MRINNGYETITATQADFGTSSIDGTRITLSHTGALWGELALEVQNVAYDCFDSPVDCKSLIYYQQVIKTTNIAVRLDIQRKTIRATVIADITATNGKTTQAKIRLDLTDEELTAVLDRFFSGYTGLNPNYEQHYKRLYEVWMQNTASRAA